MEDAQILLLHIRLPIRHQLRRLEEQIRTKSLLSNSLGLFPEFALAFGHENDEEIGTFAQPLVLLQGSLLLPHQRQRVSGGQNSRQALSESSHGLEVVRELFTYYEMSRWGRVDFAFGGSAEVGYWICTI